MSKIKKVGNTFVFINDDGIKMGSINIETEKFVGATLCYTQLSGHLQIYRNTNLDYIKKQLKSSVQELGRLRNAYFHFLEKYEALEKLEKELEEKCNAEINKIV